MNILTQSIVQNFFRVVVAVLNWVVDIRHKFHLYEFFTVLFLYIHHSCVLLGYLGKVGYIMYVYCVFVYIRKWNLLMTKRVVIDDDKWVHLWQRAMMFYEIIIIYKASRSENDVNLYFSL